MCSSKRRHYRIPGWRSSRGQAVAELAACMPLLIVILCGACYFGRLYMHIENLEMSAYYSLLWKLHGKDVTSGSWATQLETYFGLPAGVKVTSLDKPPSSEASGAMGQAMGALGYALDAIGDIQGTQVTMTYQSSYLPDMDPTTVSSRIYMDNKCMTRDEIHGSEIMLGYEGVRDLDATSWLKDVYYPF